MVRIELCNTFDSFVWCDLYDVIRTIHLYLVCGSFCMLLVFFELSEGLKRVMINTIRFYLRSLVFVCFAYDWIRHDLYVFLMYFFHYAWFFSIRTYSRCINLYENLIQNFVLSLFNFHRRYWKVSIIPNVCVLHIKW